MPEKQTVLVTGANGFLGQNIVKAFQTDNKYQLILACRDKKKLPVEYNGEIRDGDLRDEKYIAELVQGIDVICHAGTWAAMWNHKQAEYDYFYKPCLNLIDAAIKAKCQRFILASTIAVNKPNQAGEAHSHSSQGCQTGFWPHMDYLIAVEKYMQANASQNTGMVSLRLGHFIGKSNKLGIVPALVPRLKSRLVPWIANGKSRLPLITDVDLGRAFTAAADAKMLNNYEQFNICGNSFPTLREVVEFVTKESDLPEPWFNVSYRLAYIFAWLMEMLYPVLPGKAPFLTRSIVHLAEDWYSDLHYTEQKLNFRARKDWREAVSEALQELKEAQYPWPEFAQRK